MDTISEIRAMITEITDKTVLKITIPFVQNHSLRIALISCLSFSKNLKFHLEPFDFWNSRKISFYQWFLHLVYQDAVKDF